VGRASRDGAQRGGRAVATNPQHPARRTRLHRGGARRRRSPRPRARPRRRLGGRPGARVHDPRARLPPRPPGA
jgi:hypothetical protein